LASRYWGYEGTIHLYDRKPGLATIERYVLLGNERLARTWGLQGDVLNSTLFYKQNCCRDGWGECFANRSGFVFLGKTSGHLFFNAIGIVFSTEMERLDCMLFVEPDNKLLSIQERIHVLQIVTRVAMWNGNKHMPALIVIILACALADLVIFDNADRRYEMIEAHKPIIVGFPLRGEWLSPNTPGTRIPSHGTNQLGTRYAYDFIQVDWERKGWPAYRVRLLQYLFFGVPLNEYYCWGQKVYAPCDGIVIQAEDGYKERERTNFLSDMSNAYKNAHYFDPKKDDIQSVAGNYTIMKCGDQVYAALVHLQTGSIQVSVGQGVKKGEIIGRVGHSGNSFAPHLHFQLMDSSDISTANGLPCAFEQYEVFQDGEWHEVVNGIPTDKDRIRFCP